MQIRHVSHQQENKKIIFRNLIGDAGCLQFSGSITARWCVSAQNTCPWPDILGCTGWGGFGGWPLIAVLALLHLSPAPKACPNSWDKGDLVALLSMWQQGWGTSRKEQPGQGKFSIPPTAGDMVQDPSLWSAPSIAVSCVWLAAGARQKGSTSKRKAGQEIRAVSRCRVRDRRFDKKHEGVWWDEVSRCVCVCWELFISLLGEAAADEVEEDGWGCWGSRR